MSRTGILSDYHIMKHCAVFSPIPMNMAKKVLHQDLNIHTVSPFTTKKLKYSNPVSRPASFNALADSLTRIGGGDVRIKEHLVESFIREIENGNGSEYSNGNGSEYSNGTESTASTDDGVRLPDDTRRRFETPLPSTGTPMSFPRLVEDEYRRRSSGEVDLDALYGTPEAIEQRIQEIDALVAAALERATRQNEENEANPKFSSPLSEL